MKAIYKICLLSFLISSCSFKKNEISDIEIETQFTTLEENKQLVMDLANYKYGDVIRAEYPNISEGALNNSGYHYYLDDNGKVSLRMTLTNEAIDHKTTILTFFERTANAQAKSQVENKLIFEKATNLAFECLAIINAGSRDLLWDKTSTILKGITSKDAFWNTIKERNVLVKQEGEISLNHKQYYEKLLETNEKEFYSICLETAGEPLFQDYIIFHNNDGRLEIVGYHYVFATKLKM